jgi:hypothetical protein
MTVVGGLRAPHRTSVGRLSGSAGSVARASVTTAGATSCVFAICACLAASGGASVTCANRARVSSEPPARAPSLS